jgi:hypothetical protein
VELEREWDGFCLAPIEYDVKQYGEMGYCWLKWDGKVRVYQVGRGWVGKGLPREGLNRVGCWWVY